MRTQLYKSFVVLFVCLTFPLFSGNDFLSSTTKEATQVNRFVKKIVGGGRVIDAIQTTDGDYVSISRTESGSSIVRKLKSSGKTVWETSLQIPYPGGYFGGPPTLPGIAQTIDGYVLVGSIFIGGYYGVQNGIVIKLNGNGEVVWQKAIKSGSLFFFHVSASPDGGFIAVGNDYLSGGSHVTVIKFTSAGDTLWVNTYALGPYTLSQTVSDNGLILASQRYGHKNRSTGAQVIKLDDSGNTVWKRVVEVKKFDLQSLAATSDNGVIFAARRTDRSDILLLALNEKGNLAWTARYSLNIRGFGISNLIQTPDAGYALTGEITNNSGRHTGGFLMKIDASRNVVFQRAFGLVRNQEDGQSIFATSDGGFILFGSSGLDDSLVLNLNSSGVVPECTFFRSATSKMISFGNVTTDHLKIKHSPDPYISTTSFTVNSTVSRESIATVCP